VPRTQDVPGAWRYRGFTVGYGRSILETKWSTVDTPNCVPRLALPRGDDDRSARESPPRVRWAEVDSSAYFAQDDVIPM
jgi:hypothetical protein